MAYGADLLSYGNMMMRRKCADGSFCAVHRLCANPEFQNQGIARKTLERIEKTQKESGTGSIRLDACFVKIMDLQAENWYNGIMRKRRRVCAIKESMHEEEQGVYEWLKLYF